MFKKRHVYMDEADDGSSLTGGSSGAVGGAGEDRGDTLESSADIAAREAAAAASKETLDAKAAEDAAAAEALAEKAVADAAAETAAAQARDEKTGKFTKKDHTDEARIPKERFDEAVNKERAGREAAERRAAEAEAALRAQVKVETDAEADAAIEKLESQHAQHILDGDTAKAAAVMKEIRVAERKIGESRSAQAMAGVEERAVEKFRMDATISRLEVDYPALSPSSELFDEELVNYVLSEQVRLMQVDRMIPSAALQKAAEKIMSKFKPAVVAPVAEKQGLDAAAKGDTDRKADQVKKNIATAAAQPSGLKEAGLDSDKGGQTDAEPDIMKLSSEEIAALPEATKARMRGDFL